MNNKLLLHKRVNIHPQYYGILNFIHPNFNIVDDIDSYENIGTNGIIYTGKVNDTTVEKIERLTKNWIIVSSIEFDADLTTNEGLIKNLLPLHYIQLNNKCIKNNDDKLVYRELDYDTLLEKIKVCLLDNTFTITKDVSADQSVYNLFVAILCTPEILTQQYFNIVNKDNIAYITSSLLTFLSKVQSKNTLKASPSYARLITQSYKRYGRHIKPAVIKFVKSKSNKEVSLYNMLMFLNKAR